MTQSSQPTWLLEISARGKGAIGSYQRYTRKVSARTQNAAINQLYSEFDSVRMISAHELDPASDEFVAVQPNTRHTSGDRRRSDRRKSDRRLT